MIPKTLFMFINQKLTMIPEYPTYIKISPGLQPEVREFTNQYPPYSDFSFVNLMCWDNDQSARLSFLNGNLVMHYPDYVTGEHFISFLGENQAAQTAEILLEEAAQTTPERALYLVPEIGAYALLGASTFEVRQDIDSHDYVISLPKLANMQGKEFSHFRRSVNLFLRENPEAVVAELDISQTAIQEAVLRVFIEREAAKTGNDPEFELQAIIKLIADAEIYPLAAYGIEVEKQLKAFIICEIVGESWSIGHFWKADIGYRGIYSYLMHYAATVLSQSGIDKMNIQQDLGLEGLRKFKNFMRPVAQLKKYIVIET